MPTILSVAEIAYVRGADDGRHVMFAEGLEGEIAQNHHFVVTFDLLKRSPQVLTGIAGIPENQSRYESMIRFGGASVSRSMKPKSCIFMLEVCLITLTYIHRDSTQHAIR